MDARNDTPTYTLYHIAAIKSMTIKKGRGPGGVLSTHIDDYATPGITEVYTKNSITMSDFK